MTMTLGTQRPDTKVEVILGVDTHLDFHAADRGRGQPPEALRSEASFASLCGVSPIEASTGKVVRHRLNLM